MSSAVRVGVMLVKNGLGAEVIAEVGHAVSDDDDERWGVFRRRFEQGYYDQVEVIEQVAERLLPLVGDFH